MDKKIAGLLGAVAALAAVAAPITAASAMQVSSYADLLKPIPNATALLKADDADAAARAELLPATSEGDASVVLAQYYGEGYGYHHHHHHHHFRDGPRFGGPFFHHHHHGYRRFHRYHHHHHHHFRDYGY